MELTRKQVRDLPPIDRPPWWPREHSEGCIEGVIYDGKLCRDCNREWVEYVRRCRVHPAYPELLERYKAARAAWAYLRTRLLIPMDMRAYCDAYVNQKGPIPWSGTQAVVIGFSTAVDRAWRDSELT